MRCQECRESISARLDGEYSPDEVAADEHLAGCPGCRRFADDAARVTRLARTRPAEAVPDLTSAALAAWDAGAAPSPPRRRRGRRALRAGLAGAAVGQLGLALSGVLASGGAPHHGPELGGATLAHLSHETAAWNLALGVAFGWAAMNGSRSVRALVPVIGAFVGVLALLSLSDLVAGQVEPGRLVSHAVVAVGLVLLLLHRAGGRDDDGRSVVGTDPIADRTMREPPAIGPDFPRAGRGEGAGLDPTGRRVA